MFARCIVLTLLAGSQARLFKANSKSAVPITEKVTLGEAEYVGGDIEYNSCSPFDPRRYGSVKVCGMSTQLKVYLRGRCEGYHQYTETIGECATTTSCHEASVEQTRWLSGAQSYEIVPCTAR